jgi:hypothetical protein
MCAPHQHALSVPTAAGEQRFCQARPALRAHAHAAARSGRRRQKRSTQLHRI